MQSPRKSVKSFHAISTPNGFQPEEPKPAASVPVRAFHWLVGALLAFAVISPIGYHVQSIYRNNLAIKWGPWFNVNPKNTARNAPGKEMIPVAYFFFFVALPVFTAAVIYSVTKSRFQGSVSYWLHVKPQYLGRLVSYGELIFLAIIVAGNVIVFYQAIVLQLSFKGRPQLTAIANSLAFSGLYNMVFLALPATRHCFWMEWLHIPWARGVKYHRWLGVVTVVTFFCHFLFYFVQFAKNHQLADELLPCFSCNIATDGKDAWVNVFGQLALLCMVIMGLTSIPYVRRHYYATFKLVHFLFVPAIFFAVMHFDQIIVWVFVSMVLYLVNRMYSDSSIAHPVTIHTAVALPGRVTQLTFKTSTTYLPGDIVYVKVPAVSAIQWHPFSVASTPLHTPGLLTVYIKELGHWTGQLHDYVKQCNAADIVPIVYLDAGYTPPAPISPKYSTVLFIGGGIGVTPLMGQIMHLLHARPNQDVYFIWHVKAVEMASQFQSWLRELEEVAQVNHGRLHLNIYVTQQDIAEISVDTEEPSHTFTTPNMTSEPRPYAHLSTTRKLIVLILAFAFSGVLFVVVRYGQKFTRINAKYWPLQRFMEVVAVVVGCYLAYAAARVGKSFPASLSSDVELRQPSRELSREEFIVQYGLKFERAEWSKLFQNIEAERSGAAPGSIGVYVSGPKALGAAIDAETSGRPYYEVHHEEFEM
ncbi:ferric/cupric-chelate reductase [Aphanomyces cochlioides]|nr:ferric/cupric-chelate reductase [Aphanomyces cochlioides]